MQLYCSINDDLVSKRREVFLKQILPEWTAIFETWHLTQQPGRAVAQEVSRWLPTAAARVRVRAGMWSLWWTKRHCGRFSPSTSVSFASHHSTNFSIIIITRGWHNRPLAAAVPSGPNWTPPPLNQLKKITQPPMKPHKLSDTGPD
jgi:hypothetical protein